MAKKAQQKIEEQPDVDNSLNERLEALDQAYWRIAGTVENMSESIEEINKEMLRLTHLLEEKMGK